MRSFLQGRVDPAGFFLAIRKMKTVSVYAKLMNCFSLFLLVILVACESGKQPVEKVTLGANNLEYWLTTPDKSSLFENIPSAVKFTSEETTLPIIEVDTNKMYQEIDGFGYALTGGSAWLINQKLSPPKRAALL